MKPHSLNQYLQKAGYKVMQNSSYFNLQGTTRTQDKIWCIIDGDIIYQTDMTGSKQRIGVIDNVYNELSTTTQSYYDKLVELKAITPPKTAEQLAKETQDTMLEMAKLMKDMQSEIKGLKEANNGLKADSKPSVNIFPATKN